VSDAGRIESGPTHNDETVMNGARKMILFVGHPPLKIGLWVGQPAAGVPNTQSSLRSYDAPDGFPLPVSATLVRSTPQDQTLLEVVREQSRGKEKWLGWTMQVVQYFCGTIQFPYFDFEQRVRVSLICWRNMRTG
jgi:hypothetical protein